MPSGKASQVFTGGSSHSVATTPRKQGVHKESQKLSWSVSFFVPSCLCGEHCSERREKLLGGDSPVLWGAGLRCGGVDPHPRPFSHELRSRADRAHSFLAREKGAVANPSLLLPSPSREAGKQGRVARSAVYEPARGGGEGETQRQDRTFPDHL